jgi:stalled ribosome rescue protein Dom34
MSIDSHAIVWIDHAQARVIALTSETPAARVIHPIGGTPHLHHKANSIDAGHLAEDQTYLHAVGQALAKFDFVLVAGPANAKLELMKHIARHDPQLLSKVTAVQAADHPTDGQLLDLGRRHFSLNDGASAGRSLSS